MSKTQKGNNFTFLHGYGRVALVITYKNAHRHKKVFIALFMAFLQRLTFQENVCVFDEWVLRLYNSNSQIEKIVWRLTLPFQYQQKCKCIYPCRDVVMMMI